MMNLRTQERPYQIELSNSEDSPPVDETFLEDVARRTLSAERVREAKISIALVDSATIRRLNREYLNHDFETDVLSFLLEVESADPDAPADPGPVAGLSATLDVASNESTVVLARGNGKRIDGEIVLSVEMAAQSAERFSWSRRDELILYLVHGILHLCGYEDGTNAERDLMRTRECEILDLWGLRPTYYDSSESR